jgi:type VI secretion system protein ImpI
METREPYVPPAPPANLWGEPAPTNAAPEPQPRPRQPLPHDDPFGSGDMPFQPSAPMYQPQPVQPAPREAFEPPEPRDSETAPASRRTTRDAEFLARLAKGAGLPAEHFAGRDPGEVAEEIGALLNTTLGHIMQLLNARAAAKAMTRSSNRTLIRPAENNPLKFTPKPEEALRVMLGPPTRSYLNARQAIDSSFDDLKTHQIALLAAMQKAAARIFDELSPDALKKEADAGKKSLLSGGKSKYWDTFAEKWAAKIGRNEHGMLGAFLDLFAAFYDEESSPKK